MSHQTPTSLPEPARPVAALPGDAAMTDTRPSRRSRRLRPLLVSVGSLAVAAGAVVTGAAVSADAMPPETPAATDTVVVGQATVALDGSFDGFECTFTGEQAAALALPAEEVAALDASASEPVEVGPGTSVPVPGPAVDTVEGVVSSEAPIVAAEEVPSAAVSVTSSDLRAGTAEECQGMFEDITAGAG